MTMEMPLCDFVYFSYGSSYSVFTVYLYLYLYR